MRPYVVLRYLGVALLMTASAMAISAVYGMVVGDQGVVPLLFGALLTMLVGGFPVLFLPQVHRLSDREGYAVVLFCWLFVSLFGMLPYVIYGSPFNVANAWFESVSGFTTTGATIVDDVEALPRSLLLWRSLTHWLGGVGLVVFMLVLVPTIGSVQMVLTRSEVSGLARNEFKWRSRQILGVMVSTYLVLTGLLTLLLFAVGIPLFDSLNLSFSAIATGGFAVTNMSLATYGNIPAEMLICLFMFISSVHLGVVYVLLKGNFRAFFRTPVVRFYLVVTLVYSLLIAVSHLGQYSSFLLNFHHALFTVVSFFSTTGFVVTDYAKWSSPAMLLLLFTLFGGGCAGSTAGGIKQDRMQIMLYGFLSHMRRLVHPQAVITTRIGGYQVQEGVMQEVFNFILLYFAMMFASALVVSFHGMNPVECLSLAATSMANAGPILAAESAFNSLSFLPNAVKVFLPILMLFGRLEIFGVLLIFFKESWR